MNFDYLISTYHWRFESDYPLIDSSESALFRDKESVGTPDWTCRVRQVPTLPVPQGTMFSEDEERRLYLASKQLWLERLDRKDRRPLLCGTYPAEGSGEVLLWGLNSQYPYTARMEQLWAAVDFPHHLLQKGILTLHSAASEVNGQAILFLAPSGTGKSTQARLWQELRGARQLNGDKTGIVYRNGKIMACGLPICGTSGICTRFELPVAAVILLSQAPKNAIRQQTGMAALGGILQNCFGHRNVPGCLEKMLGILTPMVEQVPVYALACTPDQRAVTTLKQELGKGRGESEFLFGMD